jgi:hypothetical protein
MKTRLRLLLSSSALMVMSTTAMALPADWEPRLCNVDEMGTAYTQAYEMCTTWTSGTNASMTSCSVSGNTVSYSYKCLY